MAIKMGTENKRQVYLAVGLFVVLIGLVVHQFTGSSSPGKTNAPAKPAVNVQARSGTGSSVGTAPTLGTTTAVGTAPALPLATGGNQSGTQSAPAAEKVTSLNLDPALHLTRLSYTESILYEGRGRNIFSADSVPMEPIEKEIEPARPNTNLQATNTAPVIEKPKAPPIDLKYFGYTLSKDKSYSAFLVRGDDIFTAHSGEIVDHRYKVGKITAASVQLTDLNYNNTQDVKLAGGIAAGNRD